MPKSPFFPIMLVFCLAVPTGFGVSGIGAPARAQTAAADPVKRGGVLFLQCRACHSLKAGEPNKVGPNLAGVIGRKAASVPSFRYSGALKGANVTWTDANLDAWLQSPSRRLPGTTMAFAGIAKPQDRAALIAYLKGAAK